MKEKCKHKAGWFCDNVFLLFHPKGHVLIGTGRKRSLTFKCNLSNHGCKALRKIRIVAFASNTKKPRIFYASQEASKGKRGSEAKQP